MGVKLSVGVDQSHRNVYSSKKLEKKKQKIYRFDREKANKTKKFPQII